jgi:hypothetical protein
MRSRLLDFHTNVLPISPSARCWCRSTKRSPLRFPTSSVRTIGCGKSGRIRNGHHQPRAAPHADFAAVNVNIWLTPDSANLDPTSGGMDVYDAEAPPS